MASPGCFGWSSNSTISTATAGITFGTRGHLGRDPPWQVASPAQFWVQVLAPWRKNNNGGDDGPYLPSYISWQQVNYMKTYEMIV